MLDNKKIAIITSKFNRKITQQLQDNCCQKLLELGISAEQYKIFQVPGAVEIPYAAQCLAKTKQYCGIITLGAVIRGESAHFDYVCQQVSNGCQQVMLEQELPVIFGIITAENSTQAQARCDGSNKNIGADSASALVEMVEFEIKQTCFNL